MSIQWNIMITRSENDYVLIELVQKLKGVSMRKSFVKHHSSRYKHFENITQSNPRRISGRVGHSCFPHWWRRWSHIVFAVSPQPRHHRYVSGFAGLIRTMSNEIAGDFKTYVLLHLVKHLKCYQWFIQYGKYLKLIGPFFSVSFLFYGPLNLAQTAFLRGFLKASNQSREIGDQRSDWMVTMYDRKYRLLKSCNRPLHDHPYGCHLVRNLGKFSIV